MAVRNISSKSWMKFYRKLIKAVEILPVNKEARYFYVANIVLLVNKLHFEDISKNEDL